MLSKYLKPFRSAFKPKLLRRFDPTIARDGGNRGVIATVKEVEIKNRLVFKARTLNSTNFQVVVSKAINNMCFHWIN